MTVDFERLRVRMEGLLDALRDRLALDDQRQAAEFIEANEFGVALEWILDSLKETNRTVPRAAFALIETVAKEMGMYPTVLERLPTHLVEEDRGDNG